MAKQKEEELKPQPDYAKVPPSSITSTRRRDDVLYVAGTGCATPKVMFVAPSAVPDDVAEEKKSNGGSRTYTVKPRYLVGSYGQTLKGVLNGVGIDFYNECYYTTICKWLLPKAQRNKPKPEAIAWGMPALEAEIEELKPQIIICLGKAVFDALSGLKLNHDDAKGAWFYSKKYNAKLYLMEEVGRPVYAPYYIEIFRTDALQLRRMLDISAGIAVDTVEEDYKVIDSANQLEMWVDKMLEERHTLFSVDCEWGGTNHVDGNLRSMQLCWLPGKAIYIKFMDENRKYVFEGADYLSVGKILSRLLDRKEVKYVGHHISADLPWMATWLGLEWYEKTFLDTEFASQCLDEEAGLGLDDLALKYTDLGKYDIDLILWKKANPIPEGDGYASIPDDILIPYALKDVDTVIRAYPQILCALMEDGVMKYYKDVFNPFVTDVFTSFALLGLPIDRAQMDELRDLYNFCRERLYVKIQDELHQEAIILLNDKIQEEVPDPSELHSLVKNKEPDKAWKIIQDAVNDPKKLQEYRTFFDHYLESKNFNIKSTSQMRRWLFDVKKFTPIKTTGNKAKGLSAVPWAKWLEMPPETQKLYNPSTDKQSLQILSDTNSYKPLNRLLDLTNIVTVCNQSLKEPILDEDGNVEEEKGLHAFICSDGRVHGQMSTTETGRPRAWKPNILNWAKNVSKGICRGVGVILEELHADGKLPERFAKYVGAVDKIPSIRSCVLAPEGWCFVESDYQTAEVRGLAFISEDEELIRIMTKPDPQFGLMELDGKTIAMRLSYDANCGITPENQDPSLLTPHNHAALKRDSEGNLIHPPADLHWSLAEMMYGVPREKMEKDMHRAAAKVGNFCIAENEKVLTNRGLVPIEEINGCDLVWDGLEWVSHEGVIFKGKQEVHWYQGLWATDNHVVWTTTGEKITFAKARSQQIELCRTGSACGKTIISAFDSFPGNCASAQEWLLLPENAMCTMRSGQGDGFAEYGDRTIHQMSVHGHQQIPRSTSCHSSTTFRGDASTLSARIPCFLPQLQKQRDQSDVCIASGIHNLGTREMARYRFCGNGFGPDRQQWSLFQRQSSISYTRREYVESSAHLTNQYWNCAEVPDGSSRSNLHRNDMLELLETGHDFRGISGTSYAKQPPQRSPKSKIVNTYDLVNAGPRNRFTCSGLLVSNSSMYGASDVTLERKIEQDTGKKPEPGTGKRILDALAKRQPVATKFLLDMEKAPEDKGFLMSASGRKRHFATHNAKGVRCDDKWARKKLNAGMGREARNFYMQESVAATSAKAAKWLLHHFLKHNMQARPMVVLYDSVVTLCPLSEREEVSRLHVKYMTTDNTWKYGKNLMNYPIDNEILFRWSTKLTKTEKEFLRNIS